MNKQRRKLIASALSYLENALDIIETAKDEEEECYYNLPDGIQESERGEQMENFISMLEDIFDSLESAQDQINEIIES